jgi:hypothetical protein
VGILDAPLRWGGIRGDIKDQDDLVAALEAAVGGGPVSKTVLNVKDFGAKGDGVADDWAAIDAACDAAEASRGTTVFFPEGVYLISKSIGNGSTGYTSVRLEGDGELGSTIKVTTNVPVINGAWWVSRIKNLVLDAAGKGSPCISAHVDKTKLEALQLLGWTGHGMRLNDGTFGDLGLLNRIIDCNIDQNTGYGIWATYRFIDSWIANNNIGSSEANISVEGGPLRITDNHLDGAPRINIELRGNKRITITENILEGARESAITYTMPSWLSGDKPDIQIVGNAFSNGGKAAAGTYPAIKILGVSADKLVRGFNIVGNIFANEDAGAGWSYIIDAQFAAGISTAGNQWETGFTTSPVRFVSSEMTSIDISEGAASTFSVFRTSVSDALGTKAPLTHTHEQSDVNGLVTALAGKAFTSHSHQQSQVTGLTAALDGKAALSHTHAQSEVTGLTTALAAKSDNGHVHLPTDITGLVDAQGKIQSSFLPPISVVDVTPVSSQAAMLALNADKGDVAIRTDTNQTFILSANTPTVLSAWKEIVSPADGVLTVNGRQGPNISGLAEQTALENFAGAVTTLTNNQGAAITERELLVNKSIDPALGASDTLYSTQKAVKTYVDAQVATRAALSHTHTTANITGLDATLQSFAPITHSHNTSQVTGLDAALTARELVTNKSTVVTLGSSDTLYPSQKAVKTYTDTQISTLASSLNRLSNLATSTAGITPDPLTYFEYEITAQSTSLTIANPNVVPPNGTSLQFVVKDNGTNFPITWGSAYHPTYFTLPSQTMNGTGVTNKIFVVVFRYDSTRARWELQSYRQEA